MRDIFYFTAVNVDLAGIRDELHAAGYQHLLLNEEGDALEVGLEDGENVQFAFMDVEDEFGDPEDVEVIQNTAVASGFCISHHSYALRDVLSILRILMKKFGGWVGNDSEAFDPRFVLDELDEFEYGE